MKTSLTSLARSIFSTLLLAAGFHRKAAVYDASLDRATQRTGKVAATPTMPCQF